MRARFLLLAFTIVEIVFLGFVLFNQRGFQDSWILQDIFLPTIIYILTFVIIAIKIEDNRILVFVCSFFLMSLNAIPNLKYELFMGTFDAVGHYGYASQLLTTGFVPTTGFYAPQYSDFPGMHIFLSTISLTLGVDLITSVKFLSTVIYGIIPFMFYFATNGFFDKRLQKYIILSSGLPVTIMSYDLVGAVFAIPFFVAFICVFLRRNSSKSYNRASTIVLFIIAAGLLFSHANTIVSLVSYVAVMLILLLFLGLLKNNKSFFSYVRASWGIFGAIAVTLMAWLSLKANSILRFFVELGQSYFVGKVGEAALPSTFFRLSLIDRLKVFFLSNGRDAVFFVLMAFGLLVLLKKSSSNSRYMTRFYIPLICFLGSILLFFGLDFATGDTNYPRFINNALALSPFLTGFFLWGIDEYFRNIRKKTLFRSFMLFSVIFCCVSISLISIFPYQPLTPKASDMSKSLPANEYIFDFRSVNTIYQVDMIHFTEEFSSTNARVASDLVTRRQITGFADVAFYYQTYWNSPLDTNLTAIYGQKWDICLLHYDGRAGPLNEPVANRTRSVLDEFRVNSGSTIYDNGESFVLVNP